MKKIIAILTKKGKLCNDLQENSDMNIFQMEGSRVIGYENLKIENIDYDSFASLTKKKKIELLYMEAINEELKNMLRSIGVYTKCKDEYANDNFINRFIFD